MITRYCFVRLTDPHATEAGRAAALAELARLAHIDGLTVELGTGADSSAASWDLSIAIQAASLDVLAAAMRDRTWWEVFDGHLAARAAVIKAWNFATTPARR